MSTISIICIEHKFDNKHLWIIEILEMEKLCKSYYQLSEGSPSLLEGLALDRGAELPSLAPNTESKSIVLPAMEPKSYKQYFESLYKQYRVYH